MVPKEYFSRLASIHTLPKIEIIKATRFKQKGFMMDKNVFHSVDKDDRPELIDFGNEEFISPLLILWRGGKETWNQFKMTIESEYVPGYYFKYAFNSPQWVDLDDDEIKDVTHWMQPDISGE